jgi:hypothetical protein
MGRWYTGNLVRWVDNVMQAWGGWSVLPRSGNNKVVLNEPVRGMHAWRRNSGAPMLVMGTPTKLWHFGTNTLTDITPSGFTTGGAHAVQASGGFGRGAFGGGPFGVGDEAEDLLTEANTWQMENWHEDLVACALSDGRIFLYDTSAGGAAAPLTNAPTNCAGLCVSAENFLIALAPSGVPRRISWPDIDDITLWTEAPDNFAGYLDVKSEGRVLAGRATSRETLIWTDVDVHALRYIGGEFTYGLQFVGRSSLISRRAMGVFNDKAAWMGNRTFYVYDGEVKPLPSEVSDYVFNDLNRTQASKIHCVPRAEFQELIWYYPSGGSRECDRYVVYNWAQGFMYTGDLIRTAGVDAGIYPYVMGADDLGVIFREEIPGAEQTQLAASSEFESFTTPTADSAFGLIGAAAAQVLVTDGGLVSSARVYLARVGSPTGSITLTINNADSGGPGSTVLATAGTVLASTLNTSPTFGWVTFTFSTPVYLSPGVYALRVSYTLGDGSNYVRVGNNTEATGSWYFDGAAWSEVAASLVYGITGLGATVLTPYIESGPYEIGAGDTTMDVSEYVPDEKTRGDVSLSLYISYAPTDTETLMGPYTAAFPHTDLRINARLVRLRLVQVNKRWRFGTVKLNVQVGSER